MPLDSIPNRMPASNGSALIVVDQVTKAFKTLDGELPVLVDVSFEVRAGEVVALLGKSGSGKSTLLRCIAGLLSPSSGTVTYRGEPLVGHEPGHGDGVPELRPAALVDGVAERRARPRGQGRRRRPAPSPRRAGGRSDRARRVRVGLPEGAVGRDASARRVRQGVGRRSRGAVDG